MLVGQGAKTRPHFQPRATYHPITHTFKCKVGKARRAPITPLRLSTDRALSLLPVVGWLIMSQPYWLDDLPFLGGKWTRGQIPCPPCFFPFKKRPIPTPLPPFLSTQFVCMKGDMGKESCVWLPSCTKDRVWELVARIASCHLGFEWVKGSHVTQFHWMIFAGGMHEVFVKGKGASGLVLDPYPSCTLWQVLNP